MLKTCTCPLTPQHYTAIHVVIKKGRMSHLEVSIGAEQSGLAFCEGDQTILQLAFSRSFSQLGNPAVEFACNVTYNLVLVADDCPICNAYTILA